MKILVGAKHVVDQNVQIRIREDGSDVELQNIKMSLNPFDEIAIEEAMRLKEANIASEIIAVSIGTQSAISSLRSALSLGADRAILVELPEEAKVAAIAQQNIARIFAQIAMQENIDLVLLGRQSIDNESNQIAQMLSYELNWALLCSASKIIIDSQNQEITIEQEVDDGIQTISACLPAVVSCDLRLNEPRFPTMMKIMQAKKKNIERKALQDFALCPKINEACQIINVEEPPMRGGAGHKVKIVDNIEELITSLKQKQVI